MGRKYSYRRKAHDSFFCFDIVNLMKLPELGNERKVKVSQDYGKAGFGIN